MRSCTVGLVALSLCAPVLSAPAIAAELNDYPTEARAEFVFACMKTNGETPVALKRCSCSIDVIATILPYDHYERAATFQSLALMTGENGAMFRESKPAKEARTELRRAQAEADVRCF